MAPRIGSIKGHLESKHDAHDALPYVMLMFVCHICTCQLEIKHSNLLPTYCFFFSIFYVLTDLPTIGKLA